jgi:uncharacterized protein (DUF1697 family)
MPRYAALLRGVSPMNCQMADLKRALERSGFENVVTVLSSGNAVFDAKAASVERLEKQVEAATLKHLGREFATIVRSVEALQALLETDPFKPFKPAASAKRVVSFLKNAAKPAVKLPLERSGARVLTVRGAEAFTVYEVSDEGPVFMQLIEQAFGKDVTTRTWDTVKKVASK